MVASVGVGCDGWRGGVPGLWVVGRVVTVTKKQDYTFADGLLIGCVAGGAIAAAVITVIGWMVG